MADEFDTTLPEVRPTPLATGVQHVEVTVIGCRGCGKAGSIPLADIPQGQTDIQAFEARDWRFFPVGEEEGGAAQAHCPECSSLIEQSEQAAERNRRSW